MKSDPNTPPSCLSRKSKRVQWFISTAAAAIVAIQASPLQRGIFHNIMQEKEYGGGK